MKGISLIKGFVVATLVGSALVGFYYLLSSKVESALPTKKVKSALPMKNIASPVDGIGLFENYRLWRKASENAYQMEYETGLLCAPAQDWHSQTNPQDHPHVKKFIAVYVNSFGEEEMFIKRVPKYPVGTVIVKEKLDSPESTKPELLTAMVKRGEGFNPDVGDWEFMTLDGKASKITSQGKLENCQSCHLPHAMGDFVTREYLPEEIERKLK